MNFNKFCIQQGHELENNLGFCFHRGCQRNPEFCFLCLEECQLKHSKNCFRQYQDKIFQFAEEQGRLGDLFELLNNKNYDQVKENLNEFRQCLNHQKDSQFQFLVMDPIIEKSDGICNIIQQQINQYFIKTKINLDMDIFGSKQQLNQEFFFHKLQYDRLQQLEKYQNSEFQASQEMDQQENDEQKRIKKAEDLIQSAQTLFQSKDFEQTIRILEQSLQYKHDNDYAYYLLSSCLCKVDRLNEAYTNVIKCLQINPNYEEAYFVKGIILYNQLRYQEALECLKVAENFPKLQNAQLYTNIAKNLLELSKFDEAFKYCDLAINCDFCFGSAYNIKATIFEKLYRFEEAKLNYDLAWIQNPQDPVFLGNNGFLLHRTGQQDEALTLFNKAILQKQYLNLETYKVILKCKFEILLNLQRYEDVLICIDDMIEIEPQNIELYNRKFFVLLQLGRNEDANDVKAFMAQNWTQ